MYNINKKKNRNTQQNVRKGIKSMKYAEKSRRKKKFSKGNKNPNAIQNNSINCIPQSKTVSTHTYNVQRKCC